MAGDKFVEAENCISDYWARSANAADADDSRLSVAMVTQKM